jgi:hypothetical protein
MKQIKPNKSTLIYFSVFFGILIGGMFMLSAVAGDGYMSRIKNLAKNASFEKFVGPFITLGFLSEQPPIIEQASVGLKLGKHVVDPTPENGWTGDEYFANVISQCVFHSQESFEPLCVICKLKDADGNVIGVGSVEDFGAQYDASSKLFIDLEPDPENPASLDVQIAHDVKVDICQQNNGCTPGYWRQTQHFGSWLETVPPYSPIDPPPPPPTTFRAAFDLDDLIDTITIDTHPGGGSTITKSDTFGNSGDDITLLDTIWAQGDGIGKLVRHGTAALLNDAHPLVPYNTVLDDAEIIRLVQVAFGKIPDDKGVYQAGDFNEIADVFASANEAGGENHCPLGRNEIPGVPK